MSYSTRISHQYKATPDDFHSLHRPFGKSRVIIHPIYLTPAKDNRLDANSTTCPFGRPYFSSGRTAAGRIALNEDFKWLNSVFEVPGIKSIQSRDQAAHSTSACLGRRRPGTFRETGRTSLGDKKIMWGGGRGRDT